MCVYLNIYLSFCKKKYIYIYIYICIHISLYLLYIYIYIYICLGPLGESQPPAIQKHINPTRSSKLAELRAEIL